MYDRILVPTDGSAASERAVRHALELADVHGATLHALYVVDTGAMTGVTMETTWEGVSDMLYREGDEATAAVSDLAEAAGVAIETAVIEGSPAREIVRYAEDEGCDLVVMGTHGRGGIDRLLLGSVTERVVRSAAVPVLTLKVDRSA